MRVFIGHDIIIDDPINGDVGSPSSLSDHTRVSDFNFGEVGQ